MEAVLCVVIVLRLYGMSIMTEIKKLFIIVVLVPVILLACIYVIWILTSPKCGNEMSFVPGQSYIGIMSRTRLLHLATHVYFLDGHLNVQVMNLPEEVANERLLNQRVQNLIGAVTPFFIRADQVSVISHFRRPGISALSHWQPPSGAYWTVDICTPRAEVLKSNDFERRHAVSPPFPPPLSD